jgi:hypothetical protein
VSMQWQGQSNTLVHRQVAPVTSRSPPAPVSTPGRDLSPSRSAGIHHHMDLQTSV